MVTCSIRSYLLWSSLYVYNIIKNDLFANCCTFRVCILNNQTNMIKLSTQSTNLQTDPSSDLRFDGYTFIYEEFTSSHRFVSLCK